MSNEKIWRLLLVIVYLFLVWLMEIPDYKAIGCVMVVLIISAVCSGVKSVVKFIIG